jgi:hypothetical protein
MYRMVPRELVMQTSAPRMWWLKNWCLLGGVLLGIDFKIEVEAVEKKEMEA